VTDLTPVVYSFPSCVFTVFVFHRRYTTSLEVKTGQPRQTSPLRPSSNLFPLLISSLVSRLSGRLSGACRPYPSSAPSSRGVFPFRHTPPFFFLNGRDLLRVRSPVHFTPSGTFVDETLSSLNQDFALDSPRGPILLLPIPTPVFRFNSVFSWTPCPWTLCLGDDRFSSHHPLFSAIRPIPA